MATVEQWKPISGFSRREPKNGRASRALRTACSDCAGVLGDAVWGPRAFAEARFALELITTLPLTDRVAGTGELVAGSADAMLQGRLDQALARGKV